MDKPMQPQQLSFIFDALECQPDAGKDADHASCAEEVLPVAIVYDFRAAVVKRKESAHASLYRQILDSVRHIG